MIESHVDPKKRTLAIALNLGAFVCFSIMQLLVSLTDPNIGVMEQTFFRNLIGMVTIGALAASQKIPLYGTLKQQPALFGRSLAGLCAVASLFFSLRTGTQANTVIVGRLSLFFITMASAVIFKEKITKLHIFLMFLAFGGSWIAANPGFDSASLSLLGAFGNAVFTSIAYTLLSYFAGRVNPLTVIVHFCTVSSLVTGFFMLPSFVIPTGWNLFYLLGIGILGTMGQLGVTFAYRMAPAGELTMYEQISIPLAALLGWVFLGQTPTLRMFIGGALMILASSWLFAVKSRKD